MPYPHVIHHGAVNGVTRSCHQLPMDARSSLLTDCCLSQSRERTVEGLVGAEQPDITFALDCIKALIVTRAHADPVDRIPHLLAAIFQRPILCRDPSARLLPLILEDGFMLKLNREPKHIESYLQPLKRQVIGLPFDHWFAVAQTGALRARIRLQRAGPKLTARYLASTGGGLRSLLRVSVVA